MFLVYVAGQVGTVQWTVEVSDAALPPVTVATPWVDGEVGGGGARAHASGRRCRPRAAKW